MQSSAVTSSASPTAHELRAVSPALAGFHDTMDADLWKRPGLSPRGRSLVVLAALISRNHTLELEGQLQRALDNGLQPGEISEVVTHLAFYAGWGNAMAAVVVTSRVFERHHVDRATLPPASVDHLPIDEAAEAQRAASVQESAASVSPGLVHYTGDLLFHDLWLRPALAPRDRSLITVSALITSGQVAQIPFHLNKAMDNGLTKSEVGEVLTQLAFYAGWPNVFGAVPVVKEVLTRRT